MTTKFGDLFFSEYHKPCQPRSRKGKELNRILITALVFYLLGAGVCGAQGRFTPPVTRQPVKDQPELPEYLPEKKDGHIATPPPPATPGAPIGGPEFRLMGVVFEGAAVFSRDELLALAEPLIGRMLSVANLEE